MYFTRSYEGKWKEQCIQGGGVTRFCYVTVGGRVLCYGALKKKVEGLENGKFSVT